MSIINKAKSQGCHQRCHLKTDFRQSIFPSYAELTLKCDIGYKGCCGALLGQFMIPNIRAIHNFFDKVQRQIVIMIGGFVADAGVLAGEGVEMAG